MNATGDVVLETGSLSAPSRIGGKLTMDHSPRLPGLVGS